MAKKSADGPNKSAAIRNYKSEHSGAGPKEIAAALGKDGIKVTAGFVSTVLSNDRKKAGKGRKKGGRRMGRKPGPKPGRDPLHSIMQAKRLVDQMGSVDKARAALDALARILG